MDNKFFPIYPEFEEILTRLTPDELYEVVCAMFNFLSNGIEPDFTQGPCFKNARLLKICWEAICKIGEIKSAE